MADTTAPVQLTQALLIMLELQDLDKHLSKWDKQRNQLKKDLDDSQAELKAAAAKQDALKKSIDVEKKKRGLLELDVKTKEAEIEKHNSQLGQLSSNEAYKAKLTEIQNARKEISNIEEEILRLSANEEAIQAKFTEEAGKLAEAIKEAEAKQVVAAKASQEFEATLSGETAKREALLSAMGKDFAAVYARFFKANKGKVIVRIEDDRCNNCKMRVSAHQINEVRKQKNLCYCQSCGLILSYATPAA